VADVRFTLYAADIRAAIVNYLDIELRRDQKLKITVEAIKEGEKKEITFETLRVIIETEN
jgi:hypothetical protein